jgi:hypothetical protein
VNSDYAVIIAIPIEIEANDFDIQRGEPAHVLAGQLIELQAIDV